MNNTLLEGEPGVGKTTLLCTIADRISSLGIGGFYTREIREKSKRVGFRIETFAGQSGVLSHVAYKSGPRIGKYRVDLSTLEKIGVTGLKNALFESNIILIDEIGKMELFSERFKETVLDCFSSVKPVIATVMSKPHPFVDQLKSRLDVELIRVTSENRNKLVSRLIREITGH